jgi:hypothetical protein
MAAASPGEAPDQFTVAHLVHRIEIVDVIEDEREVVSLIRCGEIADTAAAQERIIRSAAPTFGDLLDQRVTWLESRLEQLSREATAAEAVFLAKLAAAVSHKEEDAIMLGNELLRLRVYVP